jgi:hypothetical protein
MREATVERARKYRPLLADLPIVGITGPNGSGKTLLVVAEAMHDMANGRAVYSTVDISFDGLESIAITSLSQLLTIRDATVVLDEVVSIFDSADPASSLPPEVRLLLSIARHRGLTIRWTAPAWMRAQKRLREVTQAWVSVQPAGRRGRGLWPEPWVCVVSIWDAKSSKVDADPTRRLRLRFRRPRRFTSWGAFDTLADVPIVGHLDAGGICVDCGGGRTRPKCTPERHRTLGLPEPGQLELVRAEVDS